MILCIASRLADLISAKISKGKDVFDKVFAESMKISGGLIMLMIKSHKSAPPHERVAFISLVGAIPDKLLQLS